MHSIISSHPADSTLKTVHITIRHMQIYTPSSAVHLMDRWRVGYSSAVYAMLKAQFNTLAISIWFLLFQSQTHLYLDFFSFWVQSELSQTLRHRSKWIKRLYGQSPKPYQLRLHISQYECFPIWNKVGIHPGYIPSKGNLRLVYIWHVTLHEHAKAVAMWVALFTYSPAYVMYMWRMKSNIH